MNVNKNFNTKYNLKREIELRKIILSGTSKEKEEAKEELFNMNYPLVAFVVNRYCGYHQHYEDMLQEGYLGLLLALEKFDMDKWDTKFSSYAIYWIEQRVTRYIRGATYKNLLSDNDIGIILRARKKIAEIASQENILEEDIEINESFLKEVKGTQKLSLTKLKRLLQYSTNSEVSLYTKLKDDWTIEDTLEDEDSTNEYEEILTQEVLKNFWAVVDKSLTERQSQVIHMRYEKNYTCLQIGKLLGMTKQYVSQVEKSALSKLKTVSGIADIHASFVK